MYLVHQIQICMFSSPEEKNRTWLWSLKRWSRPQIFAKFGCWFEHSKPLNGRIYCISHKTMSEMCFAEMHSGYIMLQLVNLFFPFRGFVQLSLVKVWFISFPRVNNIWNFRCSAPDRRSTPLVSYWGEGERFLLDSCCYSIHGHIIIFNVADKCCLLQHVRCPAFAEMLLGYFPRKT